MDGIAGIVYADAYQVSNLIVPMLDILKYRGSGSHHVHTFRNIQIGSTGKNSYTNKEKTLSLAIDGCLCYIDALKKILKQHGYIIETELHAEIAMCAYDLWGKEFVRHISGDFAIAVFDQAQERIYLYRDRIGKKPLYWYRDQYHFIFASELKALLATGVVPQTPARDALASYFYFGYTPQDMTPIKDVNKLLPAHYLQLEKDQSLNVCPYWSYSSYFENKIDLSTDQAANQLDRLLSQSVKALLPKEQKVGCLISGGLGSSSIAYYVSEFHKKKYIYGYSVGFEGQNKADIETAKLVANSLDIEHKCSILTPKNFLNDFVNIVWHLDEPLADPNVIATWKLAEIAKQNVDIAFSGMGSDEMLAGHNRYTVEEYTSGYKHHFSHKTSIFLKSLLTPLLEWIYQPAALALARAAGTNPWQLDYIKQSSLFDESKLKSAAPKLANYFDPEIFLHKFYHMQRINSRISSFIYFDVKTRLADCFLLQFDRLTAAHGLEWLAPYLDKNVVEFLAKIPEPQELSEGETALLIKTVLKKTFPKEVIDRPKKTRRNFLRGWTECSELNNIFLLLCKGSLVEAGLVSENWLKQAAASPQKRFENFRYLWAILSLEIWFRLFITLPVQHKQPGVSLRELLLEPTQNL
jgi:asparagine synthase (glutamine-hydrolysing)